MNAPAGYRFSISLLIFFMIGLIAMPAAPAFAQNHPPQEIWAAILRDHVDDQGRVDFAAIQRNREPLDAYVAYIGTISPDGIADRRARLAFLINSYNALAMAHVIDSFIPKRLSIIGRLRFFKLSHVDVGGRRISLYDYENDVIRPMGDERVHFALNCMSVSCPRLPRTPFTEASLDRELDAAARLFFSEARNVRVDDRQRTVWLSAIMDFYTKDFLARAPGLIAYVNRFRDQSIPVDYQVRFITYDWTINRQDPPR